MKITFTFLVLAIMVAAFASCNGNLNELTGESKTKSGNPEILSSYSQQDFTSGVTTESDQTTTTESPKNTFSKEEISNKLAALTNEDGTGIIYLGMERKEVISVLNREGIPYTVDKSFGSDGSISFKDGTFYSIYDELDRIEFRQTCKGLKIGDTAQKVKDLYGDIEVEASGSHFNYRYNYHLGEQNDVTFRIAVDGGDNLSKVIEIETYKWSSQVYESENSEGGAA